MTHPDARARLDRLAELVTEMTPHQRRTASVVFASVNATFTHHHG